MLRELAAKLGTIKEDYSTGLRQAVTPGIGHHVQGAIADDDDQYLAERVRNNPALANNKPFQNFIAPAEHAAFISDVTQMNPVSGAVGVAAAPSYNVAKQVGLLPGARSDASAQDVLWGFRGFINGLRRRF